MVDDELLLRALSHRSWCAETPGTESNERLEFLGDSVLGLVVTDHLFLTYTTLPEGELAKVRASVVNSSVLAELAAELDVGDAMLLGKGEGQSGGREKPSILADAMEALIAAVYLDRGWDAASGLVMRLLGERMTEAAAGPGGQDYKTRLQELCARQLDELPHYQVTDEGPDHAKAFDAVVVVRGTVCGSGHGRSKKQAEQGAARVAWERLTRELAASEPRSAVTSPVPATVPPSVEAGTHTAGTQPAGARSAGPRSAGTQLASTEPVVTRPEGTRPEGTRPEGTPPADTGPAGTQPADTGPAGTQPADTGPAGVQSGGRPAEYPAGQRRGA